MVAARMVVTGLRLEGGMVRILKLLVLIPITVVILGFAIANRSIITVSFDPFAVPGTSNIVIQGPLFIILFLTLMVGVFVGGIATWFTQGRNRRKARVARDEAERWQDEAMRLREEGVVSAGVPGRALIR
jgi:hypothetical protein